MARGKQQGWQRKPKDPKSMQTTRMLNMRDETYFKYHLKNILQRSEMDDKTKTSFIATLMAKASRMSIKEAKKFLNEKAEEGVVEDDVRDQISRLLDRYTKSR